MATGMITVPATEQHPLARARTGAPRTNMIHMYYQGYYWFGLKQDRLLVTYRPTTITDTGTVTATHMRVWYPR